LPERRRRIDNASVATYRKPIRLARAMACGAAPVRDFLIGRARSLSPAASVTVQNLIQIISAWNASGPELVPSHDTNEGCRWKSVTTLSLHSCRQ
jgi:hypothetical protein